jgi:hypothetical protein
MIILTYAGAVKAQEKSISIPTTKIETVKAHNEEILSEDGVGI